MVVTNASYRPWCRSQTCRKLRQSILEKFAKYFCLKGSGSKTSVRYSVMDHVTGLYLVVKYTDVVSHLLHTERQDRKRDKETDLTHCLIPHRYRNSLGEKNSDLLSVHFYF